jgi:hypothetical protein
MPAIAALIALALVTFGKLWSPGDLRRFQADLLSNAKNIDLTMQACATLNPATKAAWANTFSNIQNYCATDFGWLFVTDPDGSTHFWGGDRAVADDGEKYARELQSYGEMLVGQKCTLAAPVPEGTKPGTSDKTLDTISTVAKYAGIAAMFLGTAYVVGKVAEFIPKPAPRVAR